MATKRPSSSDSRFDLKYLKSLIHFIFTLIFIYKSVTTLSHSKFETLKNLDQFSFDLTTPSPDFLKFSHYSLISSNDPLKKSKLGHIFSPKFPPSDHKNHHWLSIILILAGDCESNPGPRSIRWPCGTCKKSVFRTTCIACDKCNTWHHAACLNLTSQNIESMKNISWYCFTCGRPNSSSSFSDFSDSSNSSNPTSILSNSFNQPGPSAAIPNPISTSTPKKTPRANPGQPQSKLPQSLKLLILNFQSLWKKRAQFSNTASHLNSDIIIGTETWLTPDIKNSELLLDEYDIFRRDRATRGGGVLIAVRKSLGCEQISQSKDSETIFCKIKLRNRKPLIVGSIYRPPNFDFSASKKILDEIYSITRKFQGAVFWFGGDFNLPDISWASQDVVGNQYDREINNSFLEMSQDLGLSQIVNFPTRGTSFLDLLFTNHPDLVKNCNISAGLGDHEAIAIETSLQAHRKKPTKRLIQLWNRANIQNLRNETRNLKHKFFDLFTHSDSVFEIWNFLKTNFCKIIENNVPTKISSSKFHQPWINTETKRMIRRKNRWFRRAKTSNTPHVWNIYKKLKSETQKTCRKTHETYLNSIFENDKSNKKLWSYIKNKRQENVGIPELRNSDKTLTNDPAKKAFLIHEQFDSVFSNPSPKITNTFKKKNRLPNIHEIKIDRKGLLKLLLNIDPNKANGPDNVPAKFLKTCAHEVVDMYVTLFQASLDQGVVPPDWKEGNIVPLYKKGDRALPENYRPVTLTSISCKLLEHVVHSNIMKHLDRFNILDDAQHGFRKRRSCVSQLLTTVDDFANCLKNHEQIDAILLDFSKAFDKVDHEGLILKLEHLGIRNSLLNWTRSFLIGRNQRVLVEGVASTPTNVLSGVPQGTVLGPLFFLIYINDISEGLSKGTKIRLFADDSLLYRTIRTPQDAKILQKDLETLQLWESKWKMEFHPGKCQKLKITNKSNSLDFQYFIHGTPISETDSAKYLGVVIDSKLNWKEQYKNINLKCNKTLAFLRRNLGSCPRQIKSQCFTTLVRPSAEYASQVWDPHYQTDIDQLEKIQKRGARFATGNFNMEHGNSEFNYKTLGWNSLEERRLQSKITTFHKAKLNLLELPLNTIQFKTRTTRQGGAGSYFRPFSPVNGHFHSFFHQTPQLWNNLPSDLRSCDNFDVFSTRIKSINLVQMKQRLCMPGAAY